MKTVRPLAFALAVLLATAALGAAQEPGKIGVTMAYPAAFGVIWHASDKIAIRPDFSFSHSSSDSPTNSSTSDVGFDVSAIVYVKKYDSVRTYVSPQFSYAHSSSSATPIGASQLPEITASGYSAGGSGTFGAQYIATPHFGIYGELGVGFRHRSTDISGSSISSPQTGSAWSTVAGVGIIFYP